MGSSPAPEPSQEEILGRTDEELFPSEMAQPTTQIKRESLDSKHRVEREFYDSKRKPTLRALPAGRKIWMVFGVELIFRSDRRVRWIVQYVQSSCASGAALSWSRMCFHFGR